MKELTIAATVENIETVTDFVNEQLESLDCPMKAQMQIDIAIDELFGNIAAAATTTPAAADTPNSSSHAFTKSFNSKTVMLLIASINSCVVILIYLH